jgi:hypothetical protein
MRRSFRARDAGMASGSKDFRLGWFSTPNYGPGYALFREIYTDVCLLYREVIDT